MANPWKNLETLLDLFVTHGRIKEANKWSILNVVKVDATKLIDDIPDDEKPGWINDHNPGSPSLNHLKKRLRKKWL